jgi:sirohydrochlorin ferrochelatase
MPAALLVAHGAPADPGPAQKWMEGLAASVARLSGWQVQGATLAEQDALEAALADLDHPIVYPFFMAQGWFTGRELPRRLAKAGAEDLTILPPFGLDPALTELMETAALQGCANAGLDPARSILVIAAHGSKISRTSADSAHAMAEALRARDQFADVTCGFVEEAPYLAEVAAGLSESICLPFFNLRAGHVAGDVPEALEKAGFTGSLLPAIGEHPLVPALIAAALERAAQ